MSDLEEKMRQWRDLEDKAIQAKDRLKGIQAANTPEFMNLAQEAEGAREAADDLFEVILRAIRSGD